MTFVQLTMPGGATTANAKTTFVSPYWIQPQGVPRQLIVTPDVAGPPVEIERPLQVYLQAVGKASLY